MVAVLKAEGLSRSFGHVLALNGADFDIDLGEVVALIGDNGAGKSTLVKALSGNLALDAGVIEFEGRPVVLESPAAASRLGIEVVHQDLALAPHLNPSQNMFLGRELPARGLLGKLGCMDNKAMRDLTREGLAELGGTVRALNSPVGSMSGGQRQAIAIARATVRGHRLILFDEPTAALGVRQTQATLDLIQRVARAGVAAIMISHNLDDVFAVGDRVVALRLGEITLDAPLSATTREEVVACMTGMQFRSPQ
jgi:simple sugar transport system ATP-binding protein